MATLERDVVRPQRRHRVHQLTLRTPSSGPWAMTTHGPPGVRNTGQLVAMPSAPAALATVTDPIRVNVASLCMAYSSTMPAAPVST